jgi:hypothetical protein
MRAILEVRRASWQIAYADVFPAARLAEMSIETWLQWWSKIFPARAASTSTQAGLQTAA